MTTAPSSTSRNSLRYVENILDDEYFDSSGSGGNPTNPFVQTDISPSRPRTAGMRFSYAF